MDIRTFDGIAQRIASLYWNQGEEVALAEQARINEEREFRMLFQGPAEGPYLGFFFFDVVTNRELYRTTVWSVRQALRKG